MRWVESESRHVLALAVSFAILGAILAANPHTVHDEGLLMYGFARSLSENFAPCFFFQKIKPALALFYAPAASFGLGPYMIAHAFFAASTLYFTHAVAKSLQHNLPLVAAAAVLLSPLFVWSSVTGVSNSDGVALIALFLYLLEVRKNHFAAGVVLGLVPWVRYEQALFSAVFAPWVLWQTRSLSFLTGLVAWPVLYLGGGAVYHHDLFWFLHFLPGISSLDPGNPVLSSDFAGHDVRSALLTLVMVSPAVFVLTLLRANRLKPIEKLMAVFTVSFFVLFVVTHLSPRDIGPAFVLGLSSRYAIVPLVPLALLVSRTVEQHEYELAPNLRDTLVAGAFLLAGWFVRTTVRAPLFVAAALGGFVAAMRSGLKKTGLFILGIFVELIPFHSDSDEMWNRFPLRDTGPESLAQWFDEQKPPGDIYTNHQLLVPYLVRTDNRYASRTKFMLAADHQFELVSLTNPANGQRAAVLATLPKAVFGNVVYPEELMPDQVRPGTWFVLINDARTEQILPPERWKSRLKLVHKTNWFEVYSLPP